MMTSSPTRPLPRVLMISDVYFPRVNGVSTSIQTIRADLAALGCESVLVAQLAEQLKTRKEELPERISGVVTRLRDGGGRVPLLHHEGHQRSHRHQGQDDQKDEGPTSIARLVHTH